MKTAPMLHLEIPLLGTVSVALASGPGVVLANLTCGSYPTVTTRLAPKDARTAGHLLVQAAACAENGTALAVPITSKEVVNVLRSAIAQIEECGLNGDNSPALADAYTLLERLDPVATATAR